ncbi:hypothetical protein KC571_02240 [candidate division WWE3 bacterium]|uniref:Uncharacterized protein n=1 Tax=candidate division WWE3 bacterium TaxID=2053526 RepID=A0A955LGM2_UNCKA|nr:hypothetical protein [candidate division WWE3 bacterium]
MKSAQEIKFEKRVIRGFRIAGVALGVLGLFLLIFKVNLGFSIFWPTAIVGGVIALFGVYKMRQTTKVSRIGAVAALVGGLMLAFSFFSDGIGISWSFVLIGAALAASSYGMEEKAKSQT